ncbi:hypothetical protein LC082_07730 [Microbacterium esteraromaticum]|uniref:sugar-transfer associated ATP-grasp domain-containing protein n=1 Tax=Microbacterium esteraromaticum TaxID=57043 RepID=UPI001CD789BC|nr:sugar-transfer associated ATP-grasp domain-containing protein [Microbacterium esteraromaticum]MCA1306785.1 hypothetical protein [Microbacterium esteraromaticum]
MTALAQPHLRHGIAPEAARSWVRETYADWQTPSASPFFIGKAHRAGFTAPVYRLAAQRGVDVLSVISQRDYYALRPLNAKRPWLRSRVVGARRLPTLAGVLEEPLAIVQRRGGRVSVVPVSDEHDASDAGVTWLVELLRSRGSARLVTLAWGNGAGRILTWADDALHLDGREVSVDELRSQLDELTRIERLLITGHTAASHANGEPADTIVQAYFGVNDDGEARSLGDDSASADAVHAIDIVRKALSAPQREFTFLQVTAQVGPDQRVTVLDIDPSPEYPAQTLFSDDANAYLKRLFEEREVQRSIRARRHSAVGRATWKLSRVGARVKAFDLRAGGFTGRAARTWVGTMEDDSGEETRATRAQVKAAHRWGFPVAVVRDFGIAATNRSQFLSLRGYLYAHPFNGKYEKWVRDRVSALMVFAPFREHFDTVHYQVFRRGEEAHIVAISAEGKDAGVSLESLRTVLGDRGPLMLMPTAWQSRTRALVAHDGTSFIVDGVVCSTSEFQELLAAVTIDQSHVLVEVDHHEQEHDASHRIDVVMMNPDGANPHVAEARLLLGGDEAAAADDAPQLESRVDLTSGAYDGARAIIDGRIENFSVDPQTGERIRGVVPRWSEVVDLLGRMVAFAPQLRFIEFSLVIEGESVRVVRVSASPTYSRLFPFHADTVAFVRELIREKRSGAYRLGARIERGLHNAKLKIRREYGKTFFPKGLVPYQAVRWPGDIRRDLMQRNGIPLSTKMWAYRHGFLSYRVPQYGITPANRQQFISDFEYRWLRHINERYKYWLEDKISIKYVAADFNEFLPAYYFYTHRSRGQNHVVPMMDCPEGYGADYADVLRLVQEKGVLALKPDEGSHGEGFYRLDWADGQYSLNGEVVTEQAVVDLLANPQNRYLVTEFITMHPDIAEIYPTSVNTIRMIVFKKDGVTPELGNAYLRIGSVASGYVDNTAAGGMLAEIEVESGRFGNAQTLNNGRVVPCPRHPDTDVLIEGQVPNWDFVKEQVLKMAASFSQLEYLGFDVAITPDGFKIPEINRFPDYPRIDRLTPSTIDYLLLKLAQKKRYYGYDRTPPRTLVKLPRRDEA